MPKRTNEVLGDAEAGASYNKLPRPENWSAQTTRKSVFDLDEEVKERVSSEHEQDAEEMEGEEEEVPSYKKKLWKKRPNASNGQWGCLPVDDGSGSENEASLEALDYLRAVRYEADGLPQLVAVSSRANYEEEEDSRGYFEDGAYLAAPEHGPTIPDDYDGDYHDEGAEDAVWAGQHEPMVRLSACEVYTTSLLSRFRALREALQRINSDAKAARHGGFLRLQVPFAPDLKAEERQKWEYMLYDTSPTPSQVASADKDSIMSLLHIIKHQCMLRGKRFSKNLGSWIFAILARLDERTMDSQMAHHLRDLAKKAVWLSIAFEPRFAEASEAMGKEAGYLGSEGSAEEAEDQGMEEAFDPSIAAPADPQTDPVDQTGDILSDVLLDNDGADETTKAALDMIVTIVGEVYGQRDLLDSRTVVDWPLIEIDDATDEDLANVPP